MCVHVSVCMCVCSGTHLVLEQAKTIVLEVVLSTCWKVQIEQERLPETELL